MKIVLLLARIVMGLMFLVFGLNIFLHFIPTPPPPGQVKAEQARASLHRELSMRRPLTLTTSKSLWWPLA